MRLPKTITGCIDLELHSHNVDVRYLPVLPIVFMETVLPTFACTLGAQPRVVLAHYVRALLACQPHTAAVEPVLAVVTTDHEPTTGTTTSGLYCHTTHSHVSNQ